MKRYTVALLFFLFGVMACETSYVEGPPGPQGPQGPAGQDGSEGYTFEYVINFEAPDYQVFLPFPDNFHMLSSDVVLVYLLWGQQDVNGETLDIWRALPQTRLTDQGTLLYNFDFTKTDVSLFMESDFPKSTLGPDYLSDWVVRIVVVPAQFANGRTALDLKDYHAVVKTFGLSDPPVDQKYLSIKRPE